MNNEAPGNWDSIVETMSDYFLSHKESLDRAEELSNMSDFALPDFLKNQITEIGLEYGLEDTGMRSSETEQL